MLGRRLILGFAAIGTAVAGSARAERRPRRLVAEEVTSETVRVQGGGVASDLVGSCSADARHGARRAVGSPGALARCPICGCPVYASAAP